MNPELLVAHFERFHTSSSSGSGTGAQSSKSGSDCSLS